VFQNGALRKIFGPNRYEVTGEGRRLHNEEIYDLHCSRNIIRVIVSRRKVSGTCSTFGDEERCIQGFGGETCGKETTCQN
jgi:hypothetical protein